MKRKIIFIADGRSDHTKRWLAFFSRNSEATLISTYDCDPIPGIKTIVLPGIFRVTNQLMSGEEKSIKQRRVMSRLIALLLRVQWAIKLWEHLRLLDLIRQRIRVNFILREIEPDVVHALRIPNEGYLTALSRRRNFIVSSWGSDFIDTAKNSFLNRTLIKFTLKRTHTFFSDCRRDIDLAQTYGLKSETPRFIFPGNGGVDTNIFYPPGELCKTHSLLYCRGLSRVTCIETLIITYQMLQDQFKNISLTIMSPTVTHAQINQLFDKHQVNKKNLNILDFSAPKTLALHMRNHSIFVSPMSSDGLPNSMLEAMSCGMVPVMSNLTSISEVITDSVNGYLFEATSYNELYTAVSSALRNLESESRFDNIKLIHSKFNYPACMEAVSKIYDGVQK